MKNFKFRYDSILNLLEDKENNVKNKLGSAYSILYEEKDKLNHLMVKDKECSELIKNKTLSGCKLSFLRNLGAYREKLSEKIFLQSDVIQKKEEEIDLIKNELLEVTKEKKIMEKLKEKKLDRFHVTLKKIEENHIDELVSYKNSLVHR